jgi:hypothetical protein
MMVFKIAYRSARRADPLKATEKHIDRIPGPLIGIHQNPFTLIPDIATRQADAKFTPSGFSPPATDHSLF